MYRRIHLCPPPPCHPGVCLDGEDGIEAAVAIPKMRPRYTYCTSARPVAVLLRGELTHQLHGTKRVAMFTR